MEVDNKSGEQGAREKVDKTTKALRQDAVRSILKSPFCPYSSRPGQQGSPEQGNKYLKAMQTFVENMHPRWLKHIIKQLHHQ